MHKTDDNFSEFSSFKQNSQNELYIEKNNSNISKNNKMKDDNINSSKTIKENSNNEVLKRIEFNSFSSIINKDKNKKKVNKLKLTKFNNIDKISKVFSNDIYGEEEEQIKNNNIITNSNLNSSILKYKSNKIKKYNLKLNDSNENNDNIKTMNINKNEKNNIIKPKKIINFNFHISDNNIILKNQKNDVIQKINDKIKNENNINSTNNAINNNSNNIINETNYNFTKNYCIIY